jgi:pheromone a factor receptor
LSISRTCFGQSIICEQTYTLLVFRPPDDYSYIFQELVTGGDLFSFILFKQNNLHDAEAAVILLQILRGVEYLHRHNIVHRDLKPENILMSSFSADSRVMLTDFGASRKIPESDAPNGTTTKHDTRMFSVVGTIEYSAP